MGPRKSSVACRGRRGGPRATTGARSRGRVSGPARAEASDGPPQRPHHRRSRKQGTGHSVAVLNRDGVPGYVRDERSWGCRD